MVAEAVPGGPGLGLYVHVPFCVQRCHYCSFNTAPLEDAGVMRRYVAALLAELDLLAARPWNPAVQITSVFLGGGTPSLLPPADLAAILDRVRHRLRVEAGAEVTMEANPESVGREALSGWREAGVTRLSLGVQALDDTLLRRLGRLHDARGARAAFEMARAAGFANVSVDLMYGLPGLDVATWADTVERVLDWQPEHLSAYGLTLDPGSRWGATGVDGLPAEETVVSQYWALVRAAAARGFEHYEISNYARSGFRSRHNLVYWQAGEYLAAGPGACGFTGDVRYGNTRALTRYCSALEEGTLPVEYAERLTPRQRLAERLILGLRTADGVPGGWLRERARDDAGLRHRLAQWRQKGLLADASGHTRLTESGFLVSDALFVELL